MKKIVFIICLLSAAHVQGQKRKSENLIVIGMDGMRWQEVFGGVDSSIMNDPLFTKERKAMKQAFWADGVQERREKLFPFFWSTIRQQGQLYGNRTCGNKVNVANPYQFTYPGFSETLTGYPDTLVNSNGLIRNKNTNVLEFINQQEGYKNKVAAFTTSVLFPFILNKWRSGLYVNADKDSLAFNSPRMQLLNEMQQLTATPIGERPDLLTYFAGREYLKAYRPKVLYIALGETDEFAHLSNYDEYIGSAHAEDRMIASLWQLVQSMPEYKDKTTLLITCDHGRGGKVKGEWTDHGQKIKDSGEIWIAVLGPDVNAIGEVQTDTQLYQGQLATTMAKIIGFTFHPSDHPVLPVISSIISR